MTLEPLEEVVQSGGSVYVCHLGHAIKADRIQGLIPDDHL